MTELRLGDIISSVSHWYSAHGSFTRAYGVDTLTMCGAVMNNGKQEYTEFSLDYLFAKNVLVITHTKLELSIQVGIDPSSSTLELDYLVHTALDILYEEGLNYENKRHTKNM